MDNRLRNLALGVLLAGLIHFFGPTVNLALGLLTEAPFNTPGAGEAERFPWLPDGSNPLLMSLETSLESAETGGSSVSRRRAAHCAYLPGDKSRSAAIAFRLGAVNWVPLYCLLGTYRI